MIRSNIQVTPFITRLLTLVLVTFAMFSIFVTSCPSPSKTPTSTNEVELSNFSFKPEDITITAGTTVTWSNKDAATHTVTSDDEFFDSGNLSKGDTFQYTFNQTGTFDYHCTLHPNMKGKVIVK